MSNKLFPIVLVLAVYSVFGWIAYLMLARPVQFVEQFLTRVYRGWGLGVTIVDQARLKRTAGRFAVLMLIFIVVHGIAVLSAILKSE